jgi:hypothetical protein
MQLSRRYVLVLSFWMACGNWMACGTSTQSKEDPGSKAVWVLGQIAEIMEHGQDGCGKMADRLNAFADKYQGLLTELSDWDQKNSESDVVQWWGKHETALVKIFKRMATSRCLDDERVRAAARRAGSFTTPSAVDDNSYELYRREFSMMKKSVLRGSGTTAPRATPSELSVKIESVKTSVLGDPGRHSLSLVIELKVETQMPHVPPELEVMVTCGGETAKEDAFFISLSRATPDTVKRDTVKLFSMDTLARIPDSCEMSFQLSHGEKRPELFCFRSATRATTPGRCAP